MMIVVADSTPLITLMKADQLDLLHELFGEIRQETYQRRSSSKGKDCSTKEKNGLNVRAEAEIEFLRAEAASKRCGM